MQPEKWSNIICKISPFEPEPVDDILQAYDPRHKGGGTCHMPAHNLHSRPSFSNPGQACIGVRVEGVLNSSELAMRLAGMAIEKDVFPVIFSREDYSGLERFGFRVERVSGVTEEEMSACEFQLKKFWSISIVI